MVRSACGSLISTDESRLKLSRHDRREWKQVIILYLHHPGASLALLHCQCLASCGCSDCRSWMIKALVLGASQPISQTWIHPDSFGSFGLASKWLDGVKTSFEMERDACVIQVLPWFLITFAPHRLCRLTSSLVWTSVRMQTSALFHLESGKKPNTCWPSITVN